MESPNFFRSAAELHDSIATKCFIGCLMQWQKIITSFRHLEILCTKGRRRMRLSGFNLTQTSPEPHFNLTSISRNLEWNHFIMGHVTAIRTFETKCPHGLAQIHLRTVSNLN